MWALHSHVAVWFQQQRNRDVLQLSAETYPSDSQEQKNVPWLWAPYEHAGHGYVLTGPPVGHMYFSLYVSHFQPYDLSAKGNVMSLCKVTNKIQSWWSRLCCPPAEVFTVSNSRASTHGTAWSTFLFTVFDYCCYLLTCVLAIGWFYIWNAFHFHVLCFGCWNWLFWKQNVRIC